VTDELRILPVEGIGRVEPGDDLAQAIAAAAPWLADGDVVVVTSKIVSKAEGRLIDVPAEEGPEREAARLAAITAETARVVAQRGPTRIVATHQGFVMAAAGVDAPMWTLVDWCCCPRILTPPRGDCVPRCASAPGTTWPSSSPTPWAGRGAWASPMSRSASPASPRSATTAVMSTPTATPFS
jgi:hypothetical protein